MIVRGQDGPGYHEAVDAPVKPLSPQFVHEGKVPIAARPAYGCLKHGFGWPKVTARIARCIEEHQVFNASAEMLKPEDCPKVFAVRAAFVAGELADGNQPVKRRGPVGFECVGDNFGCADGNESEVECMVNSRPKGPGDVGELILVDSLEAFACQGEIIHGGKILAVAEDLGNKLRRE